MSRRDEARAIVEGLVEKAGTTEGAKRGWKTRRGQMGAVEDEPAGPRARRAEPEESPAGKAPEGWAPIAAAWKRWIGVEERVQRHMGKNPKKALRAVGSLERHVRTAQRNGLASDRDAAALNDRLGELKRRIGAGEPAFGYLRMIADGFEDATQAEGGWKQGAEAGERYDREALGRWDRPWTSKRLEHIQEDLNEKGDELYALNHRITDVGRRAEVMRDAEIVVESQAERLRTMLEHERKAGAKLDGIRKLGHEMRMDMIQGNLDLADRRVRFGWEAHGQPLGYMYDIAHLQMADAVRNLRTAAGHMAHAREVRMRQDWDEWDSRVKAAWEREQPAEGGKPKWRSRGGAAEPSGPQAHPAEPEAATPGQQAQFHQVAAAASARAALSAAEEDGPLAEREAEDALDAASAASNHAQAARAAEDPATRAELAERAGRAAGTAQRHAEAAQRAALASRKRERDAIRERFMRRVAEEQGLLDAEDPVEESLAAAEGDVDVEEPDAIGRRLSEDEGIALGRQVREIIGREEKSMSNLDKAREIVEGLVEKAGTTEGAKRGWRTRRGEMAAVEPEAAGPRARAAEESEGAAGRASELAETARGDDWLKDPEKFTSDLGKLVDELRDDPKANQDAVDDLDSAYNDALTILENHQMGLYHSQEDYGIHMEEQAIDEIRDALDSLYDEAEPVSVRADRVIAAAHEAGDRAAAEAKAAGETDPETLRDVWTTAAEPFLTSEESLAVGPEERKAAQMRYRMRETISDHVREAQDMGENEEWNGGSGSRWFAQAAALREIQSWVDANNPTMEQLVSRLGGAAHGAGMDDAWGAGSAHSSAISAALGSLKSKIESLTPTKYPGAPEPEPEAAPEPESSAAGPESGLPTDSGWASTMADSATVHTEQARMGADDAWSKLVEAEGALPGIASSNLRSGADLAARSAGETLQAASIAFTSGVIDADEFREVMEGVQAQTSELREAMADDRHERGPRSGAINRAKEAAAALSEITDGLHEKLESASAEARGLGDEPEKSASPLGGLVYPGWARPGSNLGGKR